MIEMDDDSVVLEGRDAFFRCLEVEESASPHTLKAYRTDLTHFAGFLAAWTGGRDADYRGRATGRGQSAAGYDEERVLLAPSDIDAAAVRAWVARMHIAALSPVTIGRKLAAVRSFCTWRCRTGPSRPLSSIGLSSRPP